MGGRGRLGGWVGDWVGGWPASGVDAGPLGGGGAQTQGRLPALPTPPRPSPPIPAPLPPPPPPRCASAWVAALSCTVQLLCHGGRVVRAYAEDLPLGAVAALLEQSRRHRWSQQLHAWLLGVAANLMYSHGAGEEQGTDTGARATVTKPPSLASDSQRSGSGEGRLQGGSGGRRVLLLLLAGWLAGRGAGGRGSQRATCPPLPPPTHTCTPALLPGRRLAPPVNGADGAAWWAAARLDFRRLAAFGGIRAVVDGYCGAPTEAARSSLFCVLFDYVTSGRVSSARTRACVACAAGRWQCTVTVPGAFRAAVVCAPPHPAPPRLPSPPPGPQRGGRLGAHAAPPCAPQRGGGNGRGAAAHARRRGGAPHLCS